MGSKITKSSPEAPIESPIAFRPCSNGEYCPAPETYQDRQATRRYRELVEEKSRRLGLSRRQFTQSACGMATALLVINETYGCGGSDEGTERSRTGPLDGGNRASGGAGGGGGAPGAGGGSGGGVAGSTGGRLPRADAASDPTGLDAGGGGASADGAADAAGYDVHPDMMEDDAMACEALSGDEFIFDVQMHTPNPLSPWTDRPLSMDAETFIRTAFVGSDTSIGCLSGIPGARGLGRPNVEARRMLQELIDRLAGPRLIFHGNVDPFLGASELDYMEELAGAFDLAAWKVYPHVGPWRLDDDIGMPFIAKARELGVRIIAAHRGIAGDSGNMSAPSSPIDLTNAAAQNPDMAFLCYHSGWQSNVDEDHPFDPSSASQSGVDRLVKGVIDHNLGGSGNVYAELGSTWRNLMTRPRAAAHVLGKLLRFVGEDRIIWGTDSVFTGSPQEQIVALRTFQIPTEMQDSFGYPPLTNSIRRKIFGLNAASVYGVDPNAMRCAIEDDFIESLRSARREDPDSAPALRERRFGPIDRREFLHFTQWEQYFRLS